MLRTATLGLLAGLLILSDTDVRAERPNILLIVSDDQGYADAGFQGSRDIVTPHLDRLAAEGIRFTNGYVSHPVCSPSRAGFLTGCYQQRFGHETNPAFDPHDHREGLPVTERLMSDHLKDAGYVTGWIGKWHLGAAPEFRPERRGFQERFGFLGGGHRYYGWQIDPTNEYTSALQRNGEPVEIDEHLTLELGHEAAAFIARHSSEPWFLYLAFNAPHGPLEPTPERLAQFAHIKEPKRRAYAAQMSLLDDAIGETLDMLRRTEQSRRTLVFFFSDNGGPVGERSNGSSNAPLRAGKSTAYEGGIRVPFLISWPARLPQGSVYDHPVSALDVFATSLAAADLPMPTDKVYDSVNLLPYLSGENSEPPHEFLFWRNSNNGHLAVRVGDEKLVKTPADGDQQYRLDTDVGESDNLATRRPDVVTRLRSVLEAWNAELIAPAFPGLPSVVRREVLPLLDEQRHSVVAGCACACSGDSRSR